MTNFLLENFPNKNAFLNKFPEMKEIGKYSFSVRLHIFYSK